MLIPKGWILTRVVSVLLLSTVCIGQGLAQRDGRSASEPPRFGVTNSIERLALMFVNAGVRWHRTGKFIVWESVEPSPPAKANANTYDWSYPDSVVTAFQQAGAELQSMLSARSSWASDGELPKAEFLDDWERFVQAAVERYDRDGIDDMPGLLRPIRYWQLGNETYGHGIPIEAYVEFLARTHTAAQAAFAEVKIIAAEVTDVPRFLDTVDTVLIEQRARSLLDLPAGLFMLGEVAAFVHYDVFITHFNGLSRFIPSTVWFWRTRMAEAGSERLLWGGDAASGPLLGQDPLGFRDKAVVARERAIMEILETGPSHPDYAATEAWFRRVQAREAVRKPVAIVGSGVRHMYLTAASDWPTYEMSAWRYQGLVDLAGKQRPALYAYRLAIEKIGEAMDASPLDLGPGIFAFHWTTGDSMRYCLWADDADITDGNEPAVTVRLPVGSRATAVRLTTPPLAAGETEGIVETRPVMGGEVKLTLTPTPVFVEELNITSGVDEMSSIPGEFRLYQNYPNPFNPTTTIRFTISQREHVTLKVFDVLGREVARLVEGELNAGEHSVVFDAKGLASGVYFYRLTAGTFIQHKKMVVLR